jgi:stage IV sporulation protein FB
MRKIKFHPFFIIYVFVSLYYGWINNIFFYVVTVILHEYGHLFVAKSLGYETDGIIFNVYGAGLKSNNFYKRRDDILISIAGPIVNVLLMIVIVCLWWIVPTTYVFSLEFLKANIVVLVFNLLPVYPLDGGRILFAILNNKTKRNRLLKINNTICFVLGIVFITLFFISIFLTPNINLLFVGMFLSINGIIFDNNKYYEKIKAFNKTSDKPCEIKVFKVNNFDKTSLIKYVSPQYFSIFIKDNNGEKDVLNEDQLFK